MKGVEEIIRKRYSCRSYTGEPLSSAHLVALEGFVSNTGAGPFGNVPRFTVVSAEKGDAETLKGLGTYGFIRKPSGFIIGAVKEGEMALEDYGYLMEKNILYATELGIGTCWLGGSFRKSAFAMRSKAGQDEMIPAVASLGYIAARKTLTDALVRANAGSAKRKDRTELFFEAHEGVIRPLPSGQAYDIPLEMVRLAPSASNKQPWRIIKETGKNSYHFYLERTGSYTMTLKMLKLADLQRVDMGIAMCHFELAARARGLQGIWERNESASATADSGWKYIATWNGR